jgi:2'-5' RNA ligase
MEKTRGYSLWLMPSGTTYDQLSQTIQSLSKAHNTPVFEPHVTVLGSLQEKEGIVVARTKKLCEMLQPLTLRLDRIEYSAEYFRCMYYSVEKTTDLLSVYARACDIFRVSHGQYVPHVSLMYGDIPHAVKEKAAAQIQLTVRTFTADHLDLVFTDGVVKDWHSMQRFTL